MGPILDESITIATTPIDLDPHYRWQSVNGRLDESSGGGQGGYCFH
jgi:hypothetical protein